MKRSERPENSSERVSTIGRNQKFAPVLRGISVLLSIVMLWCFGISLIIVLLSIGVGFADNEESFRKSFLNTTVRNHSGQIVDYTNTQLRAEHLSYTPEIRNMLDSYRSKFDPQKTNLRFRVTDSEGNLRLTNDPGGEAEEKMLVSTVVREEIYLDTALRTFQKHFDTQSESFQTFLQADKSLYLDSNDHFILWYFTDARVDEAYHNGLDAVIPAETKEAVILFESPEKAESFPYAKHFGENYEREAADQAAIRPDSQIACYLEKDGELIDAGSNSKPIDREMTAVRVRWAAEEQKKRMMLTEYYALKQNGSKVKAADRMLEELLTGGLDITIQAEHEETEDCYILYYLPDSLPVHDQIRADYGVLSTVFTHSEGAVICLFVFLVLTVICCILMCSLAGYSAKTGLLAPSRIHGMPYEIFWLLPPVMFFGTALMLLLMKDMEPPYRVIAVFCVGMTLCIAAVSILWLYTTAVRIKAGSFWKSFGIAKLLLLLLKLLQNRTAAALTVLTYTILLGTLNVFFLDFQMPYLLQICIIILDLLTLLALLYGIYAYYELRRHVSRIETGDFSAAEHKIPLYLDFAEFDCLLNGITDSVKAIVDKQLKAEHLRTELITNVSHDLKTPLTSIVNYVDLLSREPMQNETASEYLDVLKRQAARLKKLTVDLVDASKASTGNLTVELNPTGIQVLIGQIAGEYGEQLEQHRLTLMQNIPEEPLMILADGRQIWRVFDNLLNNICKYALPDTRVYLDVLADEQNIEITLKNISSNPLNISPDELMERFVRGDSSRSTEGSGLGLSIARDLTVLQNGSLSLSTDGDLFKVTLRFPRFFPETPAEPTGQCPAP